HKKGQPGQQEIVEVVEEAIVLCRLPCEPRMTGNGETCVAAHLEEGNTTSAASCEAVPVAKSPYHQQRRGRPSRKQSPPVHFPESGREGLQMGPRELEIGRASCRERV